MSNVEMVRQGNALTIRIDLAKRFGASASGKSLIVASTGGNEALEGGYRVGVNVYLPNPDYRPDGDEVIVTTSATKGKAKAR